MGQVLILRLTRIKSCPIDSIEISTHQTQNFRKALPCGEILPTLQLKIIKKGATAMRVVDKVGNVVMEMTRPHITHARMGTARTASVRNGRESLTGL